jgi:hypothetical protein
VNDSAGSGPPPDDHVSNRRLKGLVADLTLDKHLLSEALRKKG